MTRDPLDLLRSANPVPQPIAYGEDEVTRAVAAILDRDGQPEVVIEDVPVRTHPRWLAAGLAAAAVLVLAVVSAVALTRGSSNNTAADASPVTCVVSTSGSTKVVRERLTQAEAVITSRLKQLNGTARSFVTDPGDGTVGFTPGGVPVAKAAQACRAVTVAIRPVVARPVDLDTRAPRSSDPLARLSFPVPTTEAAYARLSAAHRAQLTTAMSHYNCARASAVLACFRASGSAQVLLVGPALITGKDVERADAVGPNTGVGGSSVEWTVALAFRTAGAARFKAFTGAHHTSSSDASISGCSLTARVPCSDFLAMTADDTILTVPVTNATLESEVSISGRFTQATSQALAGDLTAASIGLRPR